jgi:hypothetical protein
VALQIDDIKLNRDDLATFLPDLRSIKAFENLQKAITGTIPDQVNDNTDSIDTLQILLGNASSDAATALMQAAIAIALAQEAQVGVLIGQVAELTAHVAELRKEIDNLKQGYPL